MIILQALYFMLPAYFANMAPVFAVKIFDKKLAWPLDFGKTYKGKEILGKNKTWRGLFAGVATGILTVYLQRYLFQFNFFKSLSFLDYTQINALLYGFLFGFGVILGDAVKSFFKRRANLKPGERWFPWDQLDFLGGLILISFAYPLNFAIVFIIALISPCLPIITNWLGYLLKLKKVPW
ncbi:MAG: CDP-archaeol synthase [Candidatus Parcubacteria bacterium]|nr:CDP-archaeol synthase [Candidatus Parcubacteria bacterium]